MVHAALQIAGLILAVTATAALFGFWAAVFAGGIATVIVSAAVEAGQR